MPLVRIDLMEGRPPEVIRDLHARVAALVAEITGSPIERVRTYITQFPPQAWGIGGVPADVSRADEVAARAAAAAARSDGAAPDGVAPDGAASDGAASDGAASDGAASDGVAGSPA